MGKLTQENIIQEIERITGFIRDFVMEHENVVVAVSGGLDSDIVARLCVRSLGKERVRFFIVVQSEMEKKFLVNARELAEELDVPLAEIHLENMNMELMQALEQGEKGDIFHTSMMLDPAKAKCSVRSSVISCYQDKGFLIAGTTNRSEKELGFFLTFGDNLSHFKPIAHLYKSELKLLAATLGTAQNVIEQDASAGFWEGQTDMEDLAYWIINDGPIVIPRDFSEEEQSRASDILSVLNQEKIDKVLELYAEGIDMNRIVLDSGLPMNIAEGLIHIVEKSKTLKNRTILREISVAEE